MTSGPLGSLDTESLPQRFTASWGTQRSRWSLPTRSDQSSAPGLDLGSDSEVSSPRSQVVSRQRRVREASVHQGSKLRGLEREISGSKQSQVVCQGPIRRGGALRPMALDARLDPEDEGELLESGAPQ